MFSGAKENPFSSLRGIMHPTKDGSSAMDANEELVGPHFRFGLSSNHHCAREKNSNPFVALRPDAVVMPVLQSNHSVLRSRTKHRTDRCRVGMPLPCWDATDFCDHFLIHRCLRENRIFVTNGYVLSHELRSMKILIPFVEFCDSMEFRWPWKKNDTC